jgi:hypothetical protein
VAPPRRDHDLLPLLGTATRSTRLDFLPPLPVLGSGGAGVRTTAAEVVCAQHWWRRRCARGSGGGGCGGGSVRATTVVLGWCGRCNWAGWGRGAGVAVLAGGLAGPLGFYFGFGKTFSAESHVASRHTCAESI